MQCEEHIDTHNDIIITAVHSGSLSGAEKLHVTADKICINVQRNFFLIVENDHIADIEVRRSSWL